jgi:uncharacterized protein DUF4388
VIPTPEQLEEIPRRQEGTLPEVPFSALLLAHALQRRTLVLEVRRRQVAKKIVLEDGVPVDCRSNLAHETFGRYLVTEGKISETDFNASLSRSAARGVPLGEVLLERGLVDAVELFRTLQANLAKKLLDLFTWRDGEFRTFADVPRVESSLKVKVPQLIFTGITRFAPQEEVDMSVGPLVGKRLALHPSPPFPLEDIRLNPRQSLLAEALRPGRRMGELVEATGLPVDEIARLLYALSVLGVVAPSESLPARATGALPIPAPPPSPAAAAPPPAPAAASPPPAPPAPPPSSAADLERRRNEVMQAYLSYRRQDAFDLLGVGEEAAMPAIQQGYLAFARRFAPWAFADADAGLREKAQDLFLAGARAFGELADVEQRNTLLFRRKTLREERARRPAAEHFAIKTDLLDSEVQFKKGKAQMDAGRYREAILLLEFASDCDPQNSLYAAELAYCRFLHSPATAAAQAARDLEETLRRDPACGIAAYYAGEVHAQLGNRDAAEAHLRRAIKLLAPDRRPIEALKALAEKKR